MTTILPFVEVRLTNPSYGSSGGPTYSTDVITTISGQEQRNIARLYPLLRFNVGHSIKDREEMQDLIYFFRARRGKAQGFRFKDWSDYDVTLQRIGTGDASTATFQLIKTYSSGGVEETRSLYKIVRGTFSLYVNSILQTEYTDYVLDYDSGVLVFESASIPAKGASIEATFEFDVPVRFDTDDMSFVFETYQSHSWQGVPLIEIRNWESPGFILMETGIDYLLQENGDKLYL